MPLTEKGQSILKSMEKTYGPEKAEQVLYASKNAGTITGIDEGERMQFTGGLQKDFADPKDCADGFGGGWDNRSGGMVDHTGDRTRDGPADLLRPGRIGIRGQQQDREAHRPAPEG